MPRRASPVLLLLLAACQRAPVDLETDADPEPEGLALLGGGGHTVDDVEITEIGSSSFDGPTDLAFHPDHPELLWVTNRDDDSVLIFDVSDGDPEADVRKGQESQHFLANPGALAFGDNGYLATAQDEDEATQMGTPVDFMGPTLWISDPEEFNGDWMSHYDMLHNSPNGVGIAWERDNAYWVFDGYHEAVTRYDFNEDHDGGGDDHSDGEVGRYVEGEVSYVEGVPSHLAYDHETDLLYIADSGNGRVAVLDTMTGEEGNRINPNYDGTDQYEVEDAEISTLVDSDAVGDLQRPSGIELRDGLVYVGDNATGIVFAFSDEGELVDWLDLGLDDGALMAIAFDEGGDLWVLDGEDDRILRVRGR